MRVRRSVALCLFVGLLSWGGCSSSDDGVSPKPNEELLGSAVIGAGGGSLTGGAATVTVPPGAFATDVELEIYLSQDANPFAGAGASDLYRLDGLPASFAQPLDIRFPVSPGKTGALVAMGEENFSPSVNGMITGYRMLATTVTDTVATGTVPAAPDAVNGEPESLPLWFVRVDGYEVDDGSSVAGATAGVRAAAAVSHFSVSYPAGKAAEAAQVRGYLETAYATITSWPFSYARRTSWPVSVTLLKLAPNIFGYFVPSRMGNNYACLEFNIDKVADVEEMKVTAGHEFFHLGQALYDNRNRWTKARTVSDRYWLDEAASVWCERSVAGRSNYTSKVRLSREMAPFEQFHVPADGNHPDYHGYGMSPLLEYLSKRQGKKVVGEIYQYIFEHGNDPVAAVRSVVEDPFIVWHPRFLRELIQGDLTPDVSLANAVAASAGTWEIKTASDTKKEYKADYIDGSARFYKIKPTRTDFSPTAVLDLALDNTTDALLNVYKYKGANMEKLGIAAGSFQVTHLDQLASDGWYLMVMVTDSHLAIPYNSKQSLTLSLEVKTPTGFTQGWANIAGDANYDVEKTNPDSTWTEKLAYYTNWGAGLPGVVYVSGSNEGNTFISSYSDTDLGISYTGTLSVTVDDTENPSQVVAFSYTTRQSQSNVTTVVTEYSCSGGGVSLSASGGGEYQFTIDGGSAAGAVGSITETTTMTNGDYKQVSTLKDVAVDYITIRLRR